MKDLKLELSKEEVETMLKALEQMPFGMVNLLINKVVEQCNEQLQQTQEVPQMEGTKEALDEL